jgi:hypothetical protein
MSAYEQQVRLRSESLDAAENILSHGGERDGLVVCSTILLRD